MPLVCFLCQKETQRLRNNLAKTYCLINICAVIHRWFSGPTVWYSQWFSDPAYAVCGMILVHRWFSDPTVWYSYTSDFLILWYDTRTPLIFWSCSMILVHWWFSDVCYSYTGDFPILWSNTRTLVIFWSYSMILVVSISSIFPLPNHSRRIFFGDITNDAKKRWNHWNICDRWDSVPQVKMDGPWNQKNVCITVKNLKVL